MFEDLAIAKQILDAGWKIVYEPEAPVFHSHHYTTVQLFKRYFDIGYALKRLEIWDEPETRTSMSRDFRKLVRKQLSRGSGTGMRHRVHAAIGQNFAKSTGLVLGAYERFLPLALKRRFSSYGIYD
jgi:rhamnosyltransferase